jgi:hypothetical protein
MRQTGMTLREISEKGLHITLWGNGDIDMLPLTQIWLFVFQGVFSFGHF